MDGCVLSQLKHSGFSILGLGPVSHLRMESSSGFIIYVTTMLKRAGGPRGVVSTAAFHARVRGSAPGLGDLK